MDDTTSLLFGLDSFRAVDRVVQVVVETAEPQGFCPECGVRTHHDGDPGPAPDDGPAAAAPGAGAPGPRASSRIIKQVTRVGYGFVNMDGLSKARRGRRHVDDQTGSGLRDLRDPAVKARLRGHHQPAAPPVRLSFRSD